MRDPKILFWVGSFFLHLCEILHAVENLVYSPVLNISTNKVLRNGINVNSIQIQILMRSLYNPVNIGNLMMEGQPG